ncbi:CD2 antigen cytoplasmic tail-binding protein 2 homolog [Cimex lectularius]|uniref:GYF domain-containing protein n=1 Tax=Cimex lectularius TaxID=79782 RepID=A0A8I6RSY1_CIMLE|nr:CD2 antigen cytoplasmic tail-binding protein 2 homolog [Cimex lectularius]
MPKRKHPIDDPLEFLNEVRRIDKNSLDSDEEDNDSDADENYRLKDEDIEGQEDGNVGLEGGVQITPFNMKEEMEEGHFDNNGMYHWKKEKVAKDNWLENIDWIKVKQGETDKNVNKSLGSDDEMLDTVDTNLLYKEILGFLQPKESIAKALKRLGGQKSLSASERLKLKKAGKLPQPTSNDDIEKVTKLTELANKILTHSGNMDIYQETYEYIQDKLNASSSKIKSDGLDMYADDFGEKEKERLTDGGAEEKKESNFQPEGSVMMWEYKRGEDSNDIKGPFTSEQMDKWSQTGHFGNGVLVRKCGTEQFYSSNRIDFDLYV